MKFEIFRFNPDTDTEGHFQPYELKDELIRPDMKLLEALELLRETDPSLSYRRSCQEGVCGSDGMHVNGRNLLACITNLSDLKSPIRIAPLPGLSIIRDLIVDMQPFYNQLQAVEPYLQKEVGVIDLKQETLQSPEARAELDGKYECILCACCSTACPSFWWNPDKFGGPAALLAANRFITDSRDSKQAERLAQLAEDEYQLYRCRSIQNCTSVCPKGLNPAKAIHEIKALIEQKHS